jgi:hypothetical protein
MRLDGASLAESPSSIDRHAQHAFVEDSDLQRAVLLRHHGLLACRAGPGGAMPSAASKRIC